MAASIIPSDITPGEERVENQQSRVSLFHILDADNSPGFAVFKLKQGHTPFTNYFCIFLTVLSLWRLTYVANDSGIPPLLRIAICMRAILMPVLIWGYIYKTKKYAPPDVLDAEGKGVMIYGDRLIITQAILVGSQMLIFVLTHDNCESSLCYENLPDKTMPFGVFSFAIMGSITFPILFPCHHACATLLATAINYLAMFVVGIFLNANNTDKLGIVFMGVIVFFTFVILEGSFYSTFLSYSKFEAALRLKVASENQEYLMKIQTEEMRHMIGNVAHDLRTPLQAFQSELELLRDKVQDAANDKTRLLRSMKQLDRICHFMNMTINRSIDFTKASSGIKLNYSIESINFSETLNWAVGCMVKSHSKVPIVVSPIPAAIHYIYTDKQWLMENMLCLLSNAQKFTTEGEIRITCSLRPSFRGTVVHKADSSNELRSKGSDAGDIDSDIETGRNDADESVRMLLIEVEDTGIGITKENQERLFKPFMQAQRRTGGTGLGLYALSKRLESLGGSCGVRDRADGASGSCFWVSIPFRPDDTVAEGVLSMRSIVSNRRSSSPLVDSQDLTPRRRNSSTKIEALMSGILNRAGSDGGVTHLSSPTRDHDPSHLRILLVDDSILIRKATSRSLIKEGHHVVLAQHGAECLKILAEADMESYDESVSEVVSSYGFDLILMDLQMPVMDGIETTKRIRALEEAERAGSGRRSNGGRHIMIIGVTANSEGEAREECIESGMDGFMEKPLKVQDLHEFMTGFNLDASANEIV